MARREFSTRTKIQAWERASGRCEECAAELRGGRVEYDHRIPDALGGEPSLENCVVLCRPCHAAKTATQDIPRIAKAKRVEAKHRGAKKPKSTLPGSRESGWKKLVGGGWVRRDA